MVSKKRVKLKAPEYEKTNLAMSWNYLKESWKWILFSLVIFIIFIIIGYFFQPSGLSIIIQEIIKQLADETKGMNFPQLLVFILKNNIVTAFLGLILGVIFGLYPLFLCLMNGYVLGFVSSKVAVSSGFFSLLRILPHGIFEIPAFIISMGLGIKMGMWVFQKNKIKNLRENFTNSLRVFLYVILPLLLIAGIIETSLIFIFG